MPIQLCAVGTENVHAISLLKWFLLRYIYRANAVKSKCNGGKNAAKTEARNKYKVNISFQSNYVRFRVCDVRAFHFVDWILLVICTLAGWLVCLFVCFHFIYLFIFWYCRFWLRVERIEWFVPYLIVHFYCTFYEMQELYTMLEMMSVSLKHRDK